jgi:DIE2/ALG10 family
LLETLTIATLPPMYFFSHIYYTDVPSIMMIFFMILFSMTKHHKMSSLFALGSVLMRQTNIVWVAGTLGVHLVDKMMVTVYPKMRRENAKFSNFMFTLKYHLRFPRIMSSFIFSSIQEFGSYMLIIVGFLVFLVKNGSIVGEFNSLSEKPRAHSIINFSRRQVSSRSDNPHPSTLLLQFVRPCVWLLFVDPSTYEKSQNLQKLEMSVGNCRPLDSHWSYRSVQHLSASLPAR